ncbi:MAG TPA: SH3-like domain-containing protein [Actinomycetota bacterium]
MREAAVPPRPGPRFGPGQRVRTAVVDPPHHTRLPRYARGRVGVVDRVQAAAPLPDDNARRIEPPRVEPVYTVRFAAADLWGQGSHTVTVDLWESYLEAVDVAVEAEGA